MRFTLASLASRASLMPLFLFACTAELGAVDPHTASASLTAADCPSGTRILSGTPGDDVLRGNAGNDCILGHGGNDTIRGGGGNDFLIGGRGNDILRGEDGNDALHGEAGEDLLVGGNGADTLRGGADSDVLRGNAGADMHFGGADNDAIHDANEGANGGGGTDICAGSSCELPRSQLLVCAVDSDCVSSMRCAAQDTCVSCADNEQCRGGLAIDFEVTIVDAGL